MTTAVATPKPTRRPEQKVERVCKFCEKPFLARKRNARWTNTGQFCSRSCNTSYRNRKDGREVLAARLRKNLAGASGSLDLHGAANPNWKGGISFTDKSRYFRTYRERYPEKVAANVAISRAVHSGKLTKQPCEVCGFDDLKRIHGHHPDYSKQLEVVWLCGPHHRQLHAALTKGA